MFTNKEISEKSKKLIIFNSCKSKTYFLKKNGIIFLQNTLLIVAVLTSIFLTGKIPKQALRLLINQFIALIIIALMAAKVI